jgi:hypothetical protein
MDGAVSGASSECEATSVIAVGAPATPPERATPDARAIRWRPRWPLIAILAVIAMLAVVGLGVALAGASVVVKPSAGTAPSTGISQQRAVELARQFAGQSAPVISAQVGAFGVVFPVPSAGPGSSFPRGRTVWVLRFSETSQHICPPPVASNAAPTCIPLQPGTLTVVLDYGTGEFVASSASYPAASQPRQLLQDSFWGS